jgi:two-component system nitrate/nitrite response regulator NarL
MDWECHTPRTAIRDQDMDEAPGSRGRRHMRGNEKHQRGTNGLRVAGSAEPITVFVLSQPRLYGDVLAVVLNRYPAIRVLGRTTDVPADIESVRELCPDVVLIDFTLEGGVSVVRAIRTAAPDAKLIALAVPETAVDVVEYAEAGISGYVTRSESLEDLVEAIHSVAKGSIVCPERVAATLIRRVEELAIERGASNGSDRKLTPREIELLQLIEQGLSNREIAERLFIALPTVKNHLHSIFAKLDVHRRSDAAAVLRKDPVLRVPRRRDANGLVPSRILRELT